MTESGRITAVLRYINSRAWCRAVSRQGASRARDDESEPETLRDAERPESLVAQGNSTGTLTWLDSSEWHVLPLQGRGRRFEPANAHR